MVLVSTSITRFAILKSHICFFMGRVMNSSPISTEVEVSARASKGSVGLGVVVLCMGVVVLCRESLCLLYSLLFGSRCHDGCLLLVYRGLVLSLRGSLREIGMQFLMPFVSRYLRLSPCLLAHCRVCICDVTPKSEGRLGSSVFIEPHSSMYRPRPPGQSFLLHHPRMLARFT